MSERKLTDHKFSELETLAAASVASGDFLPIYDASADDIKKVAADLVTFAGVTASAAEVNYNDITTLGTVQASKTVTADANKDTTGFRNVTATGSFIIGSASMDETDLEKLDGITNGTQAANKCVVADANVNTGVSKVTQLHIGASGSEVQLNATPAEINNACDVSAFSQTITASGAVTAGKKEVLLDHTSVAIAATIADTANHRGGLLVKAITEPGGGQDHTVTITTGTWNGTNKVATFADINDAIYVIFDSAGNGSVIGNVGSVAFSG